MPTTNEVVKGKVYNHDIASLSQRLFRIGQEIFKAVSANASFINQFDQTRINDYLKMLTSKLDWIVGEPLLDLPESSPTEWVVEEPAQYQTVENEASNDILRLVYLTLVELQFSQSARIASGIIKHDESRMRALIQKLNNFMTQFVAETNPEDLPESSPKYDMSGHGRQGV